MKRLMIMVLALMLMTTGVALAHFPVPTTDDRINPTVDFEDMTLTVELKGNATTGYEWVCSFDQGTMLTLVSNEYVVDETAGEEMAGVGGKSVFVFQSAKEDIGIETVTFEYKRTWEEERPLVTYAMDVWVQEEGGLRLVDLQEIAPVQVGDIVDCPECGGEQKAQVMKVYHGGQEGDGSLWSVLLLCPECGIVENN